MSSTDSTPNSRGNTPPVQHESIDNPYFLHHSDNPGQVLVLTLLNGDNYPSWQCAMIVALQMLLREPLPSVNKAYSLLLQEEKHPEALIPTMESMNSIAAIANHQSSNSGAQISLTNPTAAAANYKGHSNAPHPNGGQKFHKKIRPRCSYCDQIAHSREKCYKLHGYPSRPTIPSQAHNIEVPHSLPMQPIRLATHNSHQNNINKSFPS
ncbi:hypothetical protein RHSIM_Rhsim05G0099200 [Rhododendron simsii]|uniref:Retrotransposon Copia-like N-terminal domain-containing protein n=1 Tax=Rhododendron simsii TaxID=118357 RepID=A0A834H6V5_RHOSS|nr:hypothetical protein RHSIM_Rhsim05G0099200 [Rhododendron simsii]